MKSTSIKGQGCKSGGCAVKTAELTPGDLRRVPELGDWASREVSRSRRRSQQRA